MPRRALAPAVLILAWLALLPAAASARFGPRARPPDAFVPLSSAGEGLLLDLWDAGAYHHIPSVRAHIERLEALDALREAAPAERVSTESSIIGLSAPPALGPDAIVNNRSLSICTCSGRPLNQAEESVDAWGRYVLVSWNEPRGRCMSGTNPGQSFGYSVDFGATFREGGLLYGPSSQYLFAGDPSVAVNRKSGAFYITGLMKSGSSGTFGGVVALRGHFVADTFSIDVRTVVSLSTPDELHDKPWVAVDSLSGDVYVTWTNFNFATDSEGIELQRLDANLAPLGSRQVLRSNAIPQFDVQGSYGVAGPDGRVYVGWGATTDGTTPTSSAFEVVRSDDFGATFGPVAVAHTFSFNVEAIPPGDQRGFFEPLMSMAVDMSHGPHRGRLYLTWNEMPDVFDTVFDSSTVVVERENNNFFASPTPFTPGVKLRGSVPGVENDMFTFTGKHGQVISIFADSLNPETLTLRVRLICPSDTSTLANYHVLATYPYGFVAGLPYDGRYYLQIQSPFANVGTYTFVTGLDPPAPGDLARDIRDQFVAHSDDGLTWSAPVRINDSAVGFDGHLESIAVDGRGRVHCFWMDYRGDPSCGATSDQYLASSGDGGTTWGANRRLSDASSLWGALASCNSNNQGDFAELAIDGDHLYSAFTDSRLGDPDVFVDASVLSTTVVCPGARTIPADQNTAIDFSLANGCNFDTPLEWTLSDDAGWITGAAPAMSGSQTLAANGGTLNVSATLHPPAGSDGHSTVVRFTARDPFIPGYQDTCSTLVRSGTITATNISLVGTEVRGGRVQLTWAGPRGSGAEAEVDRRALDVPWQQVGRVVSDASGRWVYEESSVSPGDYEYRLRASIDGADVIVGARVHVAQLVLSARPQTNPSSGDAIVVSVELPTDDAATLELFDVAGRRIASRECGRLGPGWHEVNLAAGRALQGGVYVIRLTQAGRALSAKSVVLR